MEVGAQVLEAVTAHARFTHPHEACGLLAVDDQGLIRMVFCLTNIDRSSRSFTVDPTEHYHSLRYAERRGWRLGGVFHSHVGGPPLPSPRDVHLAPDPDWIHLICGPSGEVRAFWIRDGQVTEEPLVVKP